MQGGCNGGPRWFKVEVLVWREPDNNSRTSETSGNRHCGQARATRSSRFSMNPRISYVVIGLNESAHLDACLQSVREAAASAPGETLYIDGGSSDGSLDLARRTGVEQVLGGERRRRAAENRNLGWRAAKGEFIQFLDGDMKLDPEWPQAALRVLEEDAGVAAVFGRLQERNPGAFYRALQVDWQYPEGEALYCGGAACFRRTALEAAGGFPEEVKFGEEPLLCWRLRNDHGLRIRHLHQKMADHDLAYRGFRDYWRRNVRVGETYAEIAGLLRDTSDAFWAREKRHALIWGGLFIASLLLLAVGPWPVRLVILLLLALLLLRKAVQTVAGGVPGRVALLYALHTYFAKLGIAWGILRWHLRK
jgi:glycosyltransferase involved in cell wall biosynthesis